uniref:Uncharacterized protein n=1 Tax=Plectus sambesii TaxID=2011161 RepID=A0A914X2B4_9BILA
MRLKGEGEGLLDRLRSWRLPRGLTEPGECEHEREREQDLRLPFCDELAASFRVVVVVFDVPLIILSRGRCDDGRKERKSSQVLTEHYESKRIQIS